MADRVGQQLGNYCLIRVLGEGGFAEVYLGEHVYLQSQAAIKVMHARLGKDDLEAFLSEAILLDPKNVSAYLEKGYVLLDLKRYEEALAVYDLAVRLDPANAIIHNRRGFALLNLKQYPQTLQAIDQALTCDPSLGRAWLNKAVVFQALGMNAEMNQAIQKARSLGERW